MAPHSSTLAWKIPWAEEPGRLQSMGSLRVRNIWATSLSLFTFMHWRRKWQPTPVLSQGRGAWWAAVYGVAQSWARLKRLSSSSSSITPQTLILDFGLCLATCLSCTSFTLAFLLTVDPTCVTAPSLLAWVVLLHMRVLGRFQTHGRSLLPKPATPASPFLTLYPFTLLSVQNKTCACMDGKSF